MEWSIGLVRRLARLIGEMLESGQRDEGGSGEGQCGHRCQGKARLVQRQRQTA